MKVMVTGANGQLGKAMVAQLSMEGHQVCAFGKGKLDITQFADVVRTIATERPQALINCAAYNDVDGAEANWQDAYLANGIAVKHLAIACKDHGATLMHFSSDYVFDGDSERPYTIADLPNPINTYGQSKLLGEELLAAHADHYYLVRTSWVFGDGKNSFPRKLLGWASMNETLKIVDDQVSSPTYAPDLAAMSLKLLATGNYGRYHMTGSGSCSRFEWAEFVLKLSGWKGKLEPAKSSDFHTPAERPAYSVLDNFPLEVTLGGTMPSWQDATERFIKTLQRSWN